MFEEREMKKSDTIGILTVLVTGMVLIGGCTGPVSPGTVPVATPTPKIVNIIVLVTPSSAPAIAVPAARYTVGDIVWRNDSNYNIESNSSRGMMIFQVNSQSYDYQYVSRVDGEVLWSQIYPDIKTDTITSFETYYPRPVDHVSTIISQYPSKTEFDTDMAVKFVAGYC
jgi:hypothetical protein